MSLPRNLVPCRPNLPAYNGLWMARGRSWRFVEAGAEQIPTKLPGEALAARSEAASARGAAQWAGARWLALWAETGAKGARDAFAEEIARSLLRAEGWELEQLGAEGGGFEMQK